MSTLGDRIYTARTRAGRSQLDFAARTNIPAKRLSQLENDQDTPTLKELITVARMTSTTTDWLLTGKVKQCTPDECAANRLRQITQRLNLIAQARRR